MDALILTSQVVALLAGSAEVTRNTGKAPLRTTFGNS